MLTRLEMNAMKAQILKLPHSERVAEEIRLARAQGAPANARQASQISKPRDGFKEVAEPSRQADLNVVVAGREGGIGLDLSATRSIPNVLVASPFVRAVDMRELRDRTLGLGAEDVAHSLTNLDSALELVAARGDGRDLLNAATATVNATFFSHVDPSVVLGGVKNN